MNQMASGWQCPRCGTTNNSAQCDGCYVQRKESGVLIMTPPPDLSHLSSKQQTAIAKELERKSKELEKDILRIKLG